MKYTIIILSVVGIQSLTRMLVNRLSSKVNDSLKPLAKEAKKLSKLYKHKELINSFFQEKFDNELIRKKRRKLAGITIAIGIVENLFFIFLTLIFLQRSGFDSIFIEIPKYVVGWIALKVFGNYQQWSGTIIGRSTFYIFLLGSIVSISLSVLLGAVIFYSKGLL